VRRVQIPAARHDARLESAIRDYNVVIIIISTLTTAICIASAVRLVLRLTSGGSCTLSNLGEAMTSKTVGV
jgi:hypothetical protein